MRAVILAGGAAQSLQSSTTCLPNPLVPVGDMPILEIVVRQLSMSGFDRITLAVGHFADLVMAYFGMGERWGVCIDYSREETPLGTVGALTLIEDLPERFLVMNGDVLTTLNYNVFYDHHVYSNAALSIACHRCNAEIDLGVVEFNGSLHVTGYREKPTLPYDVSMGIYMFNRNILDLIDRGRHFDFPSLIRLLIQKGEHAKVYLSDDEWLDIGRQSDYAKALERFAGNKERFLPSMCHVATSCASY